MLNGKEDFVFDVDHAQESLYRMLGTPAADKLHRTLDTPHDVTEDRANLVKIVLAWLDKYLGPIN
jgi:hypothetical protein